MDNDSVIRWVNISLRTTHLIGVAGVGGAFLYQAPQVVWQPYFILLVVSGAGMLLLDIKGNPRCLLQVRGMATMIKIIILISSYFTGMEAYILITIIVISGAISHAPGKIRYYYLIKGFNGKTNASN